MLIIYVSCSIRRGMSAAPPPAENGAASIDTNTVEIDDDDDDNYMSPDASLAAKNAITNTFSPRVSDLSGSDDHTVHHAQSPTKIKFADQQGPSAAKQPHKPSKKDTKKDKKEPAKEERLLKSKAGARHATQNEEHMGVLIPDAIGLGSWEMQLEPVHNRFGQCKTTEVLLKSDADMGMGVGAGDDARDTYDDGGDDDKDAYADVDIMLRVAVASQRGFYPHAMDKKNQDNFIATPGFNCTKTRMPAGVAPGLAAAVSSSSSNRGHSAGAAAPRTHSTALFAVLDGHGTYGTECAAFARTQLQKNLQYRCQVSTGYSTVVACKCAERMS